MKNTHPTPTAPAGLFVRAFLALLCLLAAVSARAELIAYETFNSYATNDPLHNKTGGFGWSNEWRAVSGVTVSGVSISYNANGVVRGGGKSLKIAASDANALRRLIPPEVTGQTLYLSFIVQFRGGSTGQALPTNRHIFSGWQAIDASENHETDSLGVVGVLGKIGARVNNTSTVSASLQYVTTYFVVVKYTGWSGSAYKNVHVWLNPTSASETSQSASIKATALGGSSDGSSGFIGLRVRTVLDNSADFQLVDDIRIGTTWADVVTATPPFAEEPDHPALVVFGDSLSSGGANGVPSTGPIPSPSNGGYSRETWIQKLSPAAGYGVLHNSYAAGGTNYAIGGHTTTQMVGQITSYLNAHGGVADSSTLYVLWCGPNDISQAIDAAIAANPLNIFNIQSIAVSAANSARDRMRDQIKRLAAAGARKFVWGDMPNLAKTPAIYAYGSIGQAAAEQVLGAATNAFNDDMGAAITNIKSAHPAVTVERMPANAWFADIIANKTAYGFTNVTGSSTTSNSHLFYDNVHPTAHGHQVLAEKAYSFFQSKGLLAD